jgi:Immunity protein 50
MTEIQNAAALINLFGHWPDFHDGEIHAIRLDMTDHHDPSLEIAFEVAEISAEIDDRGFYRDRVRARTVMRFENVANLRLEGIYNQNCIGELNITPTVPQDFDEVLGDRDPRSRRRHRVDWSASLGMAGGFLCDDITVLSVEPSVRAS